MQDIFQILANALRPDNRLMELAAIWMENKIRTGEGVTTSRLTTGMTIRVENDVVVDCGEATHKITGCLGTISSSELYFVLQDLKTDMPITLQIKNNQF